MSNTAFGERSIIVHLATSFNASDLAWHLDEPVEIVARPAGADAEITVTQTLGQTLGHVRDWVQLSGFEDVDVTVFGETLTLTA